MLRQQNCNGFFEVSWKISEKCNMNCSYCVIKDKSAFPDAEMIRRIAYRINELIKIKQQPKSVIYITGGEPYLQDINQIVKLWLDNEYVQTVRITSNMSLDKELYLETRELLESCGKRFLLKGSYHKGDFVEFYNKCKECKADFINIVCNDDNYDWYIAQLDRTGEFDGNRHCGPLRINWMVERLPGGGVPENVKTVPQKSSTFSMDNGCWCSAGWTTIRIEPMGDIRRCFSQKVEGNILREIKTFPEKFRCERKTCSGCQNIFVYDENEIKYFHR